MNITIVIPFYNEEKNLKVLIPQLIKSLSKIKKHKFEVILVDDCSTDKSHYFAKSLSKNSNKTKFKIIKLTKRSGQTGAFKKAFKVAKGKFIIRMDADLQDNPNDIIKFVAQINIGSDLVIGKRGSRTHPFILIFCSSLYSFFMRLILTSDIKSYSSSFVAFNKKYLNKLPWYNNDHRYLPAITIQRGVKKVSEIIVQHKKRKYGVSNYNTFKKVIFGFPEIGIFLIRLKLGFYSIK